MKLFFKILIGILTVIIGIALLLTDTISYIRPISALYILCPLTLFFSTLIVAMIFCTFYWMCIKSWWTALVCALIIAASVPNVLKTYTFSAKNPTTSIEGSTSIMSYNVHLFDWFEGEKGIRNGIATLDYINSSNKDIVCLQEFLYYPNGKYTLDFIKNKLYNYKYSYVKVLNNSNKVSKCVATFSKHPIISSEDIDIKDNCHGAIINKIALNTDTITVVNFYLKSNQLTQQEKDLIPDQTITTGKQVDGLIPKIYNKLVKASLERCNESEKVKDATKDIDRNIILCGDMNDIPASYAYRTLIENRKDAFLQMEDWDMGVTFHEGIYKFRIDYILTSENIGLLAFEIDKQPMSDHYPITLDFICNQ